MLSHPTRPLAIAAFVLAALAGGCAWGDKAAPTPTQIPSPTRTAVPGAPPQAGEIDDLDIQRTLLPPDIVGEYWSRTAPLSNTEDITFIDPCGRQPRQTLQAGFQHLRKPFEGSTTPDILQSIGRFESQEAAVFIQDAGFRCSGWEARRLDLGDYSAVYFLEEPGAPLESLQEYVVLVRRGDWIMAIIFFSLDGREKFDPDDIARIAASADERFRRLITGESD
jgi:hypothetical protein